MYLSEYCDVNYNETYNIVFVKWKKFCCIEDYRKPCLMQFKYIYDIDEVSTER